MVHGQIRTISTSGISFRVALCGPETSNETFLCFNGVGLGLEALLPLASELPDRRTILIDAPGIGGSSEAPGPYRLSKLCDMVVEVLDSLGIDRIHLFGVSWGGAVAQQFAYQYPERCASLILAATSSGLLSIPGNLGLFAQFANPKKLLSLSFLSKISPELATLGKNALNENARVLALAMKGLRPKGYLHQILAMTGWTSWPWLPRIQTPTLILMGKNDPLMLVSNGRIIASRLPNAELDIMPFGHLFVYTQPSETARKIGDFLGSIPANEAT